jgi:hypothetical protein
MLAMDRLYGMVANDGHPTLHETSIASYFLQSASHVLGWEATDVMETDEQKFTDEALTKACGLHMDNLRRLITWRAVVPVQAGGGRGRVRLWTLSQALRISVTAQFFDAGFSLRMAHTLTYCLPLDDMLQRYDPALLSNVKTSEEDRELLSPEPYLLQSSRDRIGHVYVLDRKYVYTDVHGQLPELFGVLSLDENRFYPTYDPSRFLWGLIANMLNRRPRKIAIREIDRSSLLLGDIYFRGKQREFNKAHAALFRQIDTQIIDWDRITFRNCLVIDLSVGLELTFRRLLNLPVSYSPNLRME